MEKALILAEGLLNSSDAKTAHGLLRKSLRWDIVGVIDSTLASKDITKIVPGVKKRVEIYPSLEEALEKNPSTSTLIIGVATAGGRLPENYRNIVKKAIECGLNVISGLHEFLSDDPEIAKLAEKNNVKIIDVRKIYHNMKIFYTGRIREVSAKKIVVLGTDACVGKRTVAWMIHDELNERGYKTVFIGTGQTSWMQGAKYGIVLDSMINDFITGGLEYEVWRAYVMEKPEYVIVPGQGSLLHPVFPGSLEIVNLLSPEYVILQHAPGRKHLEDFPEYPMPSLDRYIELIKILTGNKPIAITLNSEGLTWKEVEKVSREIEEKYGIVSCCPLIQGVGKVVDLIVSDRRR